MKHSHRLIEFSVGLCLIAAILFISCRSPQETEEIDPVAKSEEFAPLETTPVPQGSHSELGLAGYAKVLCSAIFVSGREPEEAFQNSGFFFMPEQDQGHVSYTVDYENSSVTLALRDSLTRSAFYTGDQGCIIQTERGLQFEPVNVQTVLPDAMSQPWPMGDVTENTLLEEVDGQLLAEAVDLAFSPAEALTAAFLVVYKGEIIAERYIPGIDKDTQLESWSMGKSLTATFIGRMIELGYFQMDDPAPVPAWQQEGDPRKEIRIRDLLQMSSGLRFTSHRDPEVGNYTRYLDHMYIYTGAVNAFEYSQNRPLQFPVGTEGRYRNCDPLTLGFVMRRTLEKNGVNYHTWGQSELFDKIGIRRQVMETDPYGNFLLTGYDYGTARNWARLGLLYLNKGLWEGERILPEGWTEFVSTKAPAWKEPVYGGLFWLNETGTFTLPRDAFYMGGAGGQRTIIVPSLDLVIVRLGHLRGGAYSDQSLNSALEVLVEAIK